MKRINNSTDLVYFKFFVYLMGIVLVLGCMFLSYIAYQRHLMDFPQQSAAQPAELCNGGTMQLHVDGEVEFSIQDGNRVFLLSKPNSNAQELLIIDYCENKLISRVSLSNSEYSAQTPNEEILPVIEDDSMSSITIDSDKLSKAG